MSQELSFRSAVDVALRDSPAGPQVVSCAAVSSTGEALQPGTLIVAVNGQSVDTMRAAAVRGLIREARRPLALRFRWPSDLRESPLGARAQARRVDDVVRRKLSTADREEEGAVSVRLAGGASLGLHLETDFYGTHLRVRAVDEASQASAAGVREGWLVVGVNGRSLEGLPFRRAMDLLRRECEGAAELRLREDSAHYRELDRVGADGAADAVASLRAQHLALSQALSVERFYHDKCKSVLMALLARVGPVRLGDLRYAAPKDGLAWLLGRQQPGSLWGALVPQAAHGDAWLVELSLPVGALPRARFEHDAAGRIVMRPRELSGDALPPLCAGAELLAVNGTSVLGLTVAATHALLQRVRASITVDDYTLALRVPGAAPADDSEGDENGVQFEVEFYTDAVGLALETGYGGHGVVVREVDPAGEAAAHPHIVPGIEVMAVDGVPAAEVAFAQVVAGIREGARPVTVQFKDADRRLDVSEGAFDVLFDAGPLGMRVEADFYGEHAVVAACEPHSQAARVHPPLAGFVLTAANGRSLEGLRYLDAMRVLREERDQPPPLVLRFLDEHRHYSRRGRGAALDDPLVEQQIAAWLSTRLHDERDAHAQCRRLTAVALDAAREELCGDVAEGAADFE